MPSRDEETQALHEQVQLMLAGHSLEAAYGAALRAHAICLVHSADSLEAALCLADDTPEMLRACIKANFAHIKQVTGTFSAGNEPEQAT